MQGPQCPGYVRAILRPTEERQPVHCQRKSYCEQVLEQREKAMEDNMILAQKNVGIDRPNSENSTTKSSGQRPSIWQVVSPGLEREPNDIHSGRDGPFRG